MAHGKEAVRKVTEVNSQLFEKIANLKLLEVEDEKICASCGISASELNEILEDENFKTYLSKEIADDIENSKDLDDAWETIEKKSLMRVMKKLELNPDADFALRCAIMANKSLKRHRSAANRPIQGQLGTRAVIYLNPRFTQNIVKQETVVLQEKTEVPKKQSNFLGVKSVQKLLHDTEKDAEEKLMNAFGNALAPAE